jgi:transcriptional regulator
MCEIIRKHPLATLVSGIAGNARITLLPLLVEIDEEGRVFLSGHLDRNNEHSDDLDVGRLISFQFVGPDSYASSDLYPDPQLPGWLYVSVQGDGQVVEEMSDQELRELLIQSTEEFGAAEQRFSLDESDQRIDKFLPGIKGFRIKVTRISGIAKLAQDKGPVDARTAMEFLANQDNAGSRDLFERLLRESNN